MQELWVERNSSNHRRNTFELAENYKWGFTCCEIAAWADEQRLSWVEVRKEDSPWLAASTLG
jgi:hypothetical protein